MLALVVSNLALIGLLVWVIRTSGEREQTLLDRIQAPERVVERRTEPVGDDPEPVPFEDDEAFHDAMKDR